MIKGNSYNKGKIVEIKSQLQHQLKEVEAKEQASKLDDSDKTKFILFLKEPIRLNLIPPQDAQELIEAVEKGQHSIKDAIKLVEDLLK